MRMQASDFNFWTVVGKTAVIHTITYFIMGVAAYNLFDYAALLSSPTMSCFMRPATDPVLGLAPVFQPVRGILFGCVFYLLREVFFRKPGGWLSMWIMLVFLGMLSTFAPAPGSVEGLIYTTFTFSEHWGGFLEIMAQSLLLAVLTVYWVKRPGRKWLSRTLLLLFVIVLLLPIAGLLAALASGSH
ncbi:MAG TPA: hypothetical protein GXX29_11025 [Firmicutes bacterium]|nr:hypothetical protein [Bacillota bacterium]